MTREALRERIERNLASHCRTTATSAELRPAAVTVAIVTDNADEYCFDLIRRSNTLRAHGGQWAMPGGRVDPGETSAEAALRELDEEVGIKASAGSILGLLDDYPTRSGFSITPVVVWCGSGSNLVMNAAEVAEAHLVPIAELVRPGVPRLRSIPQSDRPVISIPLAGTQVHAPTGAVLYQFREVALLARSTRVDHFEQPVFAWK